MAAGSLTPQEFAASLLHALGIHQTPGGVQAITGWERAEGGHWNNSAKYNPLNTTLALPNSSTFRSVGPGAANIRAYGSWQQGLEATVKTLQGSAYKGIRQALASGDPGRVADAIGRSPWGTAGGLVQKAIAGTPRVAGVHAGLTTGAAPAAGGASTAPAGTVQTTTSGGGVPDAQSSAVLEQLTAALAQPRQPRVSAGVQAPAFSAHAVMPAGYAGLQPGAGPAPASSGVDSLIAAAGQSQGDLPSSATTTTASPVAGAQPGSAKDLAGSLVKAAVDRANTINSKQLPYLWGGGHAGKVDPKTTGPLDCSGAVSAVLGIDPRVSGQFEHFGSAGAAPGGKGITIYANKTHVLMEINGHFFGTSHANPGGGAGWIPRSQLPASYLKSFTARHLAASV